MERSPYLRSLLSSALWTGSIVLAGCSGGGGGGGGGGGATASGSILFLDTSGAVVEAEPNDSADQPHDLGALAAGDERTLVGHTSETPPDDDRFAFEADALLEIDLTLAFDGTGANDFDLAVYDPLAQDFPFVFNSTSEPEVGTFQWQGPFQLVVVAFAGEGGYTLELGATAARVAGVHAEETPRRVGSLARGRSMRLGGAGGERERVLVRSPSQASLVCTLAGDPTAELRVGDATDDELAPLPLARGGVGATTITTEPLELVELEVRAAGPWTLEVSAEDPSGTTPLAPVRPRAPRPRPLSGKLAAWTHGERLAAIALPMVPGELLVRAGRDEDHAGFVRELGFFGASEIERIPGGAARVQLDLRASVANREGDALRATVALCAALATSPRFDYVQPNYVRQALQVPDDPFYNLQWHYPLIQLPAAWDVTTGDANTIVCVIDTGSTDHPDLVARQIGGFDMIGNPTVAGDGGGRDADPTDVGDGQGVQPSSFHGTHVAGTIGAESDNGEGVTGVTWAGRILHVRVLGIGGGTDFDIANGILYAARLANVSGVLPDERADVINMSLGGPGFSQTTQDACTSAHDAGVVVVAAAGNNNSPNLFYPASNEDVISVSAVAFDSERAPYSNFNAKVDIAGPGGDTSADLNGDGYADGVLSTLVDDTTNPDSFIFAFYQGTSMASPHVAGVAALVLAANPALTPDQVETVLTSTATDLGAAGRDNLFGHGLINAFAAVTAAAGTGSPDPLLGLSTLSVAFAAAEDLQSVQVTNVGGGVLDVTSVVASTETGGAWLDAAPVSAPSTTTDVTSIQVGVDRTGLADGVYAGAIDVQSDGGNATILVSLVVATAPAVEDVDIFVLAVDAATLETRAQDEVNPTTILDYDLSGLPAGDYLLVAGSDDDGDDFICGPGDRYCGLYPTLDQPLIVTVAAGMNLAGLDFTVSTQSVGRSARPPARGFALR